MLSRFFYKPPKEVFPVIEPDIILTVERQSDGSSVVVPLDLNTMLNPLQGLSYTDFSLSECLKKGVSYKSLQISSDLRLGFDSEIDSFNDKLEDISDQLFNSKD